METISIVRGNDFRLRIPIKRHVLQPGGSVTEEDFVLEDVRVLKVFLESCEFHAIELYCQPDEEVEGGIVCNVDGLIPLGTYHLIVAGIRQDGTKFRSKERRQLRIVDNNERANIWPAEYDGFEAYSLDTMIILDVRGRDGLSAYEIAVLHGFTGTEDQWLKQLAIKSIVKTGTDDLVDTYTITYSNGATSTFQLQNGESAYHAAVRLGKFVGTEEEWATYARWPEVEDLVDHTLRDMGVSVDESDTEAEATADMDYDEDRDPKVQLNLHNIKGRQGERGNGITSIEQTTQSDQDGGINVVNIKTTDDQEGVNVIIRNGRTGAKGDDFQPIEDMTGLSIASDIGLDATKVMSQKGVTDLLLAFDDADTFHKQSGTILSSGAPSSSSDYTRWFFPNRGYSFIVYSNLITVNTQCYLAFYSGTPSSSTLLENGGKVGNNAVKNGTIAIPEGCEYIGIATKNSQISSVSAPSAFKIYAAKPLSSLAQSVQEGNNYEPVASGAVHQALTDTAANYITDTIRTTNEKLVKSSAVAPLSKVFDSRWEGMGVAWEGGLVYTDTGKLGSSSNAKRCRILNDDYREIYYVGNIMNSYNVVTFYNSTTPSQDSFISQVRGGGTGSVKSGSALVPEGCVLIIFSTYNTIFDNSYFELYANNLHKVAKLEKQVAEMSGDEDISDVITNAIAEAKEEVTDELTFALDQTGVTRLYKKLNDVGTHQSSDADDDNTSFSTYDIVNKGYCKIEAKLRNSKNDYVIAFYSSETPSASTCIGGVLSTDTALKSYVTTEIPSECKCIAICTTNYSINHGTGWFKLYSNPIEYTKKTFEDIDQDNYETEFNLGLVNDIVSLNDPIGTVRKLKSMREHNYEKAYNHLMLMHFSDLHYTTNTSRDNSGNFLRMLQWRKKYASYIDAVISTGDQVWNLYDHDFTFWTGNEDANDVLVAIGNHETSLEINENVVTAAAAREDVYNKFIAPNVENWGVVHEGTNNYYYKDFTQAGGVRLIVLDVYYDVENQSTWLANVLADAQQNDKLVIIAEHVPFKKMTPIPCSFSSMGTPTESNILGTPTTDSSTTCIETFVAIVDTFQQNGGKLVCWLSGHRHRDIVCTHTDYPDQLMVSIDCATPVLGAQNMAIRYLGTKNQDCFNVVAVNRDNTTITLMRVGLDYDRMLRHKGTCVIDYVHKRVLYND